MTVQHPGDREARQTPFLCFTCEMALGMMPRFPDATVLL